MHFMKDHLPHVLITVFICLFLCGCNKIGDGNTYADPTPSPVKEPVIAIDDDRTKEPVINEGSDEAVAEDTETTEDTEPSEEPATYDPDDYFTIEEISDELFERMKGRSFPDDCATKREDLRYLRLLYKDLDGNTHEGEMVCNKAIADKLTDIFRQLYEADYPIEKIRLIDEYGGDDDASMADNNTSCFNYRVVSGTNKISKHGYGLAVDLNPFYNPYVHTVDGETVIEPAGSEPYADREADYDYKIDKDDPAYKLFTAAGFTWGGSWKTMKDYQHFQMD